MGKVIICGEKEGISCSCAGRNPKIVLAHMGRVPLRGVKNRGPIALI